MAGSVMEKLFNDLLQPIGQKKFNREPREIREQGKIKTPFPFSRILRISRL